VQAHTGQVGLSEADAPDDPLTLFDAWYADAVAAQLPEPTAMVLATVGSDGWPQARTVLLKGHDERGLRFFTNLGSPKAAALAATRRAALVFPWHPLHRQVRVVGAVEVLSRGEVTAYFSTRPRDSQLGAWASPQSQIIGSRAELDELVAEVESRFPDGAEVPPPPHWGGFRLVPREWEFWAGRQGRLHDRLRYRRSDGGSGAGGGWVRERLAP
jgi:pyridoxamine 5'-phosphate oxidase